MITEKRLAKLQKWMFGWKRDFTPGKQIDHDVDSYMYNVICFPSEHVDVFLLCLVVTLG